MMTIGWMRPPFGGGMAGGPLRFATMMVDAVEQGATVYWSFFGPFGEAAIATVETAAGIQRRYLAWLSETFGVTGVPLARDDGIRLGAELVGWGARD